VSEDLDKDNIDWERLEWEARRDLYFNRFNINATYKGTKGEKPSEYKLKGKKKGNRIS
jgi:hypothetical protein